MSHPRLYGRWLDAARGIWIVIALLGVVLFVAGVPARFEQLRSAAEASRALRELGLSVSFYVGYFTSVALLVGFVHLALATFIFWRRSADRLCTFVSAVLIVNGTTAPLSGIYALEATSPGWGLLVRFFEYLAVASSVGLLFVFPNGHFVPRWTRLLALAWSVLTLPAVFFPNSPFSFTAWPALLEILVLLGWSGSGVYAQIYRYNRVSSPFERQQVRWVSLGLIAAVLRPFGHFLPFGILPLLSQPVLPNVLYQVVGSTFFTLSLIFQLVGFTVLAVLMLLFPVIFAVAILRYRMWDIDLIINRTLVYTLLTAILGGMYISSIQLFRTVFLVLTGQDSDAAIVLTTLVVAAAFTPVRSSLQTLVDKRFKEPRDSSRELKAFRERVWSVAEVMDTNRLTQRLLNEAAHAFDAESGAVHLQRNNGITAQHSYGDWSGDAQLSVPIAFNGTEFGLLSLGARRNGSDYTTDDRQNLQDSATAVAYAIALAEHQEWLSPRPENNHEGESVDQQARKETPA